jgi:hypothetical protein
VEGSSDLCSEPSGSVSRWEILELLSDWRLLKDSAPWSYFVTYNIGLMVNIEEVLA